MSRRGAGVRETDLRVESVLLSVVGISTESRSVYEKMEKFDGFSA